MLKNAQPIKHYIKPAELVKRVWFLSAQVTDITPVSTNKLRQIGLIYAGYRVLVGLFLVVANQTFKGKFANLVEGKVVLPEVYESYLIGAYISLGVLLLMLLYWWRAHTRKQLLAGFFVDMFALSLFMYSSIASSLQAVLLFMVVTAASFMLLKLRHAIVVTLLAICSLIFQQIYYSVSEQTTFLSFGDTIMLCISLIAVGFLSWSISQRLAAAEKAALDNAKEISRLNAVNEEAIRHIENGIIVIGTTGRILMINEAATQLLRLPTNKMYSNVLERILDLERSLVKDYPAFVKWYSFANDESTFTLNLPKHTDSRTDRLYIRKKPLPEHGQMLVIEDLSHEQRIAQQMKLASLGQLSASIAHEIRNPLGVISQASQMLMEDAPEDDGDRELYQMIFSQTQRVNRIIEDVMRLSRQELPRQEVIDLKTWLPNFLMQYYPLDAIALSFDMEGLILFDPHHLEQIFSNLINNALRHTRHISGASDVQIMIHATSDDVLIDVIDNGEGVAEADLPSLFNPFFTTSKGGTGLGLYLSQAFSEANHARLIYLPDKPKTCFRLIGRRCHGQGSDCLAH